MENILEADWKNDKGVRTPPQRSMKLAAAGGDAFVRISMRTARPWAACIAV
ncbi:MULTISPECIES: hypothetical protein [unclassified Acidovorax]|uniref:hypothetical protein n=1 Tax=unclassified Acidovorax TaxID=2684926 RepID=UPI002882EAA8|nr:MULTISPECIES: hypothetical protein [unclassified Acidovorax]